MRISDFQLLANNHSPTMANIVKTNSTNLLNAMNNPTNPTNYSLPNSQSKYASFSEEATDFSNTVINTNTAAARVMSIAWDQQKNVSADNAAITGAAKDSAKAAKYDISISQLAAAQRNDGSILTGYDHSRLAEGNYSFGITIGNGTEQKISIQVAATDSNRQVMDKIASAINAAKTGVKATLKTSGAKQYLSLESDSMGTAKGFSIRDIDGNCAASYRLDTVTQKAADAIYTVDGTKYQSSSNTASLDNGNVTLKLNAVTSKKATVLITNNKDMTLAKISDLVTQYNHLNEILSDSSSATKSGKTLLTGAQALVSVVHSKDFASMGITINTAGTISIDNKKLAAALDASPDKVKSLLTATNGLAANLKNASAAAMNVSVDHYLSPSFSSSAGYGSSSAFNPTASQYGLLFNQRG